MTTISQKEYLKKYLKIGSKSGEKKKKKKTAEAIRKGMKIIDDDVDAILSHEIQDDIDAANEDAPQIVAVIDERPHSMIINEKTKSSLWKPIGEPSNATEFQSFKMASIKLNKNRDDVEKISLLNTKNNRNISTGNKSKTRDNKHFISKQNDDSPVRAETKYAPKESDYSPPRKSRISDNLMTKDQDYSPERKSNKDHSPKRKRNNDNSSPKKRDYDVSPPRQKDQDYSLMEKDKDYSPLRKKGQDYSPLREADQDFSPKRTKDRDISPVRRKQCSQMEKDYSPPRKRNKNYSPPRKINQDYSLPRHRNEDSPVRDKDKSTKKRSRWEKEDSPPSNPLKKPETTMSGKKSGLQNAKNLVQDLARLQKDEEAMFRTMSAEVSGINAKTIVRKKKHEEVIDPQKEAREIELKEKYCVWGKGLKQVQDESEKYAEQQREMNKPLARYADDEDLERYLKEQEREGDPMLAYIRKKKKKVAVEQGIPEKPMYMGDFMPNRFGIRPGYRWDGVDRSNGYEKKWFETQNAKKALQEEATKWSTEDM